MTAFVVSAGKTFHCTECGKCCTVRPWYAGPADSSAPPWYSWYCTQHIDQQRVMQGQGEVWINNADLDRLSAKINLQRQHFLARYTKSYSRRPGWWLLRNSPGTQVCSFRH